MRVGHTAAVEAGQAIFDSKGCRLLDIDEELRMSAWNLLVRHRDQEFSFTDCTSFAAMKALRLDEAFTFDRTDFAAADFTALPID